MNKKMLIAVVVVGTIIIGFLTLSPVLVNPCSDVMTNIKIAANYPDSVKITSCSVSEDGTKKGLFKAKNAFGMEGTNSFYCKKDGYYKCTFN